MRSLDITSPTTVLFLDMLKVDSVHNAELVVNQAAKCSANPVLPLGDQDSWDLGWAAPWSGSILFDEEEAAARCGLQSGGMRRSDAGRDTDSGPLGR